MKPISDGALRVACMFDALPPKMKLRVVRVLEGQQTETRKLANSSECLRSDSDTAVRIGRSIKPRHRKVSGLSFAVDTLRRGRSVILASGPAHICDRKCQAGSLQRAIRPNIE